MPAILRWLLKQPAIISSVLVTGLVLGIKYTGAFEFMELKAFDQMMQRRSDSGLDRRILIVKVTEEDLHKWNWPLSGKVIKELFQKLELNQPKVIGFDIFRDLPIEPGHSELLAYMQNSDRIIPVCQHADESWERPAIASPRGINAERVGFSDVVIDSDNITRRNLLVVGLESSSSCAATQSLGLQLATRYLAQTGIKSTFTPDGELQIGTTIFKRLHSNSGGYEKIDDRGYQILLNYRSPKQVAEEVTLTQVLLGQVNQDLIKDRIVIIGSTAASLKDIFNTPFSVGRQDIPAMPGVVMHGQMASQILSAVLDKQPQFWFLPEWGEMIWIWVWSLAGGILAWRTQHPLRLGATSVVVLCVLIGVNFTIFTQAGWLPTVSPILGFVITIVGVVEKIAYDAEQERKKIALQVQEQEKAMSLLQALLREGSGATELGVTTLDSLGSTTLLNKRYQINQLLSSGGFSHTYLAEDTQRPGNPKCVVKQLKPARNDERFLEVARRLFKTEAEILELLGKHEQIPQLLAYFEENKQFYLLQEYIEGHCLSDELIPGNCLTEAQVIDLLKDVLGILTFVHSHQVIHRDIKPSNLIRRKRDNRLVLIDFGAVKLINPHDPNTEEQTVAIGTAGYAPPEQLIGHPTINSDIYALGMIGIQSLTGTPAKQLQRDVVSALLIWRKLAPQTNEKLAAILDRMVAYDFTTRYQSAAEVLQSLENL